MTLALEGIRIIDLCQMAPGAFCTMILGDLGAEVITIVPPNSPFHQGATEGEENRWEVYNAHNRNKKSLILNLREEDALHVLLKLVMKSDVIVEGYRPGVIKRLGVDYETVKKINSRIIYCSMSGYGQDGPYNQLPGHDINYISIGGVLGLVGEPDGSPIIPSNLIADFGGASLHAAIGILAALMARAKTGQGQFVDISYLDSAISLQTLEASLYFATGMLPKRGKTWLTGVAPFYNTYKTRDGKYISIGCLEAHFWQNLCQELGKAEFIPYQFSDDKYDEMFSFFRKAFLAKDRAEWFKLLSGKNIPITPVYDFDEVFTDPQVLHRQMLMEIDHPGFDKVKQVGVPIKLSDTPAQVRSLGTNPGAHTNEILTSLGYSLKEIENMRKTGALG
jgi:crotonobetainyl-CoA:carnitine CoA-transferase CaiB-like acyl-CoA transferase